MSAACFLRLVLLFAAALLGVGSSIAQDTSPATAAQAAAVLDLSKFPMIEPTEDNWQSVIASQSYLSTGKMVDVAQKIQKALQDAGWKELDGASYTEDYSSASFQKDGFSVSMTVMPGGANGSISVSLFNHGNVDLKKLPKPDGVKEIYAMPMSIILMADASAEETSATYKRLLTEQGWEPFGDTTVSFFVKKNAVRLQVMISDSPAEPGKASIQISSEQLSFDFPVPPDAIGLSISDSTGQMMFDSEQSQADCVAWFREELGKSDWQATTENPVKIDFREHLIFRNPAEEIIEIAFSTFEAKTRVSLQYKTAAQVSAESEAAGKLSAEMQAEREAELERKMNPSKIKIAAPAGTTVQEQTEKRMEFSIANGTAKAALATWIMKLQADGWESNAIVDTKEAGEYELTKDGAKLNAGFIDPGFIGGSITISVWGDYQLELAK